MRRFDAFTVIVSLALFALAGCAGLAKYGLEAGADDDASTSPFDAGPLSLEAGFDAANDGPRGDGKGACGASSCAGCCAKDGTCKKGDESKFCGKGGDVCIDCAVSKVPECQKCGCQPDCASKYCGDADGCGGTCTSGCKASSCAYKPDSTTIALYTFSGAGAAVSDVTGNYPGALVGSAVKRVASGKTGCGNALAFTAGSPASYMSIADRPIWDLKSGSVDLWVRFSSTPKEREGVISRDANGTNKPGHITVMRVCTGAIFVRLQRSDTEQYNRCSSPIAAGAWHHLGINFGKTGLHFFIDGKAADSTKTITCGTTTFKCSDAPTVGIDGNENPWVVGGASMTSTEGGAEPVMLPMSGKIDSLRISSAPRTF